MVAKGTYFYVCTKCGRYHEIAIKSEGRTNHSIGGDGRCCSITMVVMDGEVIGFNLSNTLKELKGDPDTIRTLYAPKR